MKKWNMIIDIAKCHDCNNCFLACKDEFVDNDWPSYSLAQPAAGQRWMNIHRQERGQYPKVDVSFLPLPCMHCDNAPCIKAAKDGAVTKRKDGIVIIDPEKAKGQKDLVDSCPYGAIFWNAKLAVPQKCTFCAHLIDDGWEQTRCVQACPTGAITVVMAEDAEMAKMVKAEGLEVYLPEQKTKPRVYYKNLHLYTKCHIAGSVALQKEDECAEGAKVTLLKAKKNIAETVTNNYGDFKFDGLDPESGQYTLEVECSGRKKQTAKVALKESINVGTIFV